MRIALLVHCFFPRSFYGTEAYSLSLAKEFMAAGHEVTVISAVFQGDTPQAGPVERYVWDGVPVVSIDKNALPHASVAETYDQPAMRAVHEGILRDLKPDLLHVCHLINHTVAAVEAAAGLNISVFATLTDFFGFCLTNKLEAADGTLCAGPSASRINCLACHLKADAAQPWANAASRRIGSGIARAAASRALAVAARIMPGRRFNGLRPADVVRRPDVLKRAMSIYRGAIAPSRFLKGAYEANGFPAPLRLSHFGIDIDRAAKPMPADSGRIRLGYIGQLAAHKGVDLLLRALRAAEAPNIELTIWGDEAQDAAYAARLRTLSEGLAVRFAGTVAREKLASALAGIDALAIPSLWYENSPLILLQALATHTPVLVADVEGLTEFIEPGRSGHAFARGDVGALTNLLKDLAAAPDQLRAMSAQTGYDRTTRAMASDVLALYAEHGLT